MKVWDMGTVGGIPNRTLNGGGGSPLENVLFTMDWYGDDNPHEPSIPCAIQQDSFTPTLPSKICSSFLLLPLRQYLIQFLFQYLRDNLPIYRAPDFRHDHTHEGPERRLLLLPDKI